MCRADREGRPELIPGANPMVTFKALGADDLATLQAPTSTVDLAPYRAQIDLMKDERGVADGGPDYSFWHKITPDAGETTRLLRRRLFRAATEAGVHVHYHPKSTK